MKKVYCENCKYLRDNYSRFGYRPLVYFCHSPKNLKELTTYLTKWSAGLMTPGHLNKSNKCKSYRRKWYKFWA